MIGSSIAVAGMMTSGMAARAQAPTDQDRLCDLDVRTRSPGAAVTIRPNDHLWVKDVNVADGIKPESAAERVPIEVIEYYDRSNSDDTCRGGRAGRHAGQRPFYPFAVEHRTRTCRRADPAAITGTRISP